MIAKNSTASKKPIQNMFQNALILFDRTSLNQLYGSDKYRKLEKDRGHK